MKSSSTYINIRTYLSYSLRLELIWNYTFLPFLYHYHQCIVFIYSVIHLFSYVYFYSMYLFYDLYILHKLMSISCISFYFLSFLLQFFILISWHCGRCIDGGSMYVCLVGVGGRLYICLWGGGLVLN